MASTDANTIRMPFENPIVNQSGVVTQAWQYALRLFQTLLEPLGVEQNFTLVNNQSAAANITGMALNYKQTSHGIVDYIIQRVTTGTGATEIVSGGCFHLVYKPTSPVWEIQERNTPGAGAFTAAATDICTRTAHNMLLGHSVQLTTTGTLPAGLSLATNYWVVPTGADTFKLASSYANAQSGSNAVDITDAGTGTHTITPNPGVKFSVTTAGQVQYTSTSITGTASISKISWRMRTLGGKSSTYSSAGPRA